MSMIACKNRGLEVYMKELRALFVSKYGSNGDEEGNEAGSRI